MVVFCVCGEAPVTIGRVAALVPPIHTANTGAARRLDPGLWVVLLLGTLAAWPLLTRASLVDELKTDFVRTARAKGAAEGRIVIEHALRPAFGPVLAYLATAAAGVLTGSMVVETLFAIPGLGYFFIAGALQRDWTVISGAALLYAALLVVFNLLADLGLLWCDPRTR